MKIKIIWAAVCLLVSIDSFAAKKGPEDVVKKGNVPVALALPTVKEIRDQFSKALSGNDRILAIQIIIGTKKSYPNQLKFAEDLERLYRDKYNEDPMEGSTAQNVKMMEEITGLRTQIGSLTTKVTSLETSNRALEAEKASLMQQLDDAQDHHNICKKQIEEMQKQLDELQKAVAEKKA